MFLQAPFISFAQQNARVNVICKRTSSNKPRDEGITIIRHPKNPQVVEGDYRCSHSQLPMAATRNWSIFADHVGHSAHFVVECSLPKVPLTMMACGSFRLKVVTMGYKGRRFWCFLKEGGSPFHLT